MRNRRLIALAVMAMMGMSVGCGKKRAPAPPSGGVRTVRGVVVPAWAPKDPSPEFLRAAKMLKPLPDEVIAPGKSGPEKQALLRRYAANAVPVYEFFGTLTEEQIRKLIAAKETRLPIRQLTASQRKALNPWIDASLIGLYKDGAARDLSNVDAGFTVAGHYVFFFFWVRKQDGTTPMSGGTVAYM